MSNLHNIIKKLEETGSSKEKLKILEYNHDNQWLQWFFKKSLTPGLIYGIKQIPVVDNHIGFETIENMDELLIGLETRKLSGNAAKNALSDALMSLDECDAEILQKIITKDPGCGVQATTVNKVWKGLIPVWKWRGAAPFDKKQILSKMRWPAFAQIKMDGMRLTIVIRDGDVKAFTRSGQVMPLCEDLQNQFLEAYDGDSVIDGEAVCHNENGSVMSRKKSNGILNHILKGKPTPEKLAKVHHYAWDRIKIDDFYKGFSDTTTEYRYGSVIDNFGGRLHKVEQHTVESYEHCLKIFRKAIDDGQEGIILKDKLAPWVPGKSHKMDWKIKEEFTAELEVIGWNEHTKKKGQIGSLVTTSSCTKLESGVGSGLTDSDRKAPFEARYENQIITVKFNDLITDKKTGMHSLVNPVFVEIRTDKDSADTLEDIKKEIENTRELY